VLNSERIEGMERAKRGEEGRISCCTAKPVREERERD
jgi:hypothetical protein